MPEIVEGEVVGVEVVVVEVFVVVGVGFGVGELSRDEVVGQVGGARK